MKTAHMPKDSRLLSGLRKVFMPFVFALSMLVPRDDDLWVFTAGDGERFADNSKYLFLYCDDREDVRDVWITTSKETEEGLEDEGYEAYTTRSLSGKYLMLRAGVFFETHGPVRPEYTGLAKIVHLTHGNYLKKMLEDYDRNRFFVVDLLVEVFFERRRRFVVTSYGDPARNVTSMFGIPEERLLVTGFPRNDALFGAVEGERIGLNETELERVSGIQGKVLLYAPTWREAYGDLNGVSVSEIEFDFDDLDALLGESGAHLLVSPHPATSFPVETEGYENVSMLETGGDLYPFLRRCDALITDYSGVFYDYLLLDRPTIFYAPDLEEYEESRGFYFDYESHVPGPIAHDSSELADAVEDVLDDESDEYSDERRRLRSVFYEHVDDESSRRVYDTVR